MQPEYIDLIKIEKDGQTSYIARDVAHNLTVVGANPRAAITRLVESYKDSLNTLYENDLLTTKKGS